MFMQGDAEADKSASHSISTIDLRVQLLQNTNQVFRIIEPPTFFSMLKRTHSDADLDGNANDEREARDVDALARFEMVKRTYSKAYHHGSKHYDNISVKDNARAHYGDVYRCK